MLLIFTHITFTHKKSFRRRLRYILYANRVSGSQESFQIKFGLNINSSWLGIGCISFHWCIVNSFVSLLDITEENCIENFLPLKICSNQNTSMAILCDSAHPMWSAEKWISMQCLWTTTYYAQKGKEECWKHEKWQMTKGHFYFTASHKFTCS